MKSFFFALLLGCLLFVFLLEIEARALGPRAPLVAAGQSVDDDIYLDQGDDDGTDHGRDGQTKYRRIGQEPREERVNGARKRPGDMKKRDAPKKPNTPLARNTKHKDSP